FSRRQSVCSSNRRFTLSTLFPYTTLFRSLALGFDQRARGSGRRGHAGDVGRVQRRLRQGRRHRQDLPLALHRRLDRLHRLRGGRDRKSTRLNSSHVKISYAVVCLKQKKEE